MESPKEKAPQKDPDEIELLKNKENYILLNEENNKVEDVTNEIKNFLKNLKKGQTIQTKDFNLETTMSAIEINHYKMDPHCHNEKVETYKVLLKKKLIKPMDELNLEESLLIINSLFKREITWICGGSIQQNLFSLIYFTDDSINDTEGIYYSIFRTFINSILHILYLCYSNINESSCLREEDFSCIYYPNSKYLKRDNILTEIKKVEKDLHSQSNSNNKKFVEQILNRFRIQKNLISLFSEQFDKKNKNRYDNLIINVNELKNELNLINLDLIPKLDSFNIDIYFNTDLVKIYPSLSNNKKGEIYDNEKAIEKINAFIKSLNSICFIYETNNIYHLLNSLYEINISSPSFIIREILDINLFPENNMLFGKYDMQENIKEIFKQLKIPILEEETLNYIIATQKDLCKRRLRNKARLVRESKEIIDNLTAVVIEGHKKESALTSNSKINKTVLTNFLLKNVLNEMLNTIYVNFSLGMFKIYELDYVFYVCESIVNQLAIHNYVIGSKYGEKVLKEENIAESILKKKFSVVQKMILDETYIYKSLKLVFNSLKLLIHYIKAKKMIKMPICSEKENELRIINRFPYFKNCHMFINLSNEGFIQSLNEETSNEDYLSQANVNLKISIQILNELKAADPKLRDYTSYDNDYITNLSRAIISNSFLFGKIKKKEENKDTSFLNISLNITKYKTFLPIIEIK